MSEEQSLYLELNRRGAVLREELFTSRMTNKEFMGLPRVCALYEWYARELEKLATQRKKEE